MKLGYWAIRGLAAPARCILAHAGIEYEEDRYAITPKEGGGWDRSCWFDVKFTLGLPFPNLPYLIDGDLKITQSMAIWQHCARKAGIEGSTDEVKARAASVVGALEDARKAYVRWSYTDAGENSDEMKKELLDKTLPTFLAQLNAVLSNGGPYVCGEELTWADYVVYDLVEQWLELSKATVAAHTSVLAHYKKIDESAPMQAFKKSKHFIDHPYNNLSANFK